MHFWTALPLRPKSESLEKTPLPLRALKESAPVGIRSSAPVRSERSAEALRHEHRLPYDKRLVRYLQFNFEDNDERALGREKLDPNDECLEEPEKQSSG